MVAGAEPASACVAGSDAATPGRVAGIVTCVVFRIIIAYLLLRGGVTPHADGGPR